MTPTGTSTAPARRSRSDGERSRSAILDAAAQLATIEGIEGLSIGRLAEHVGMSKSGVYAHFGSKEELQLATIGLAEEIFERDVVAPTLRAPEGLERLEALCERFLSHVERSVFAGGCFFASLAAEMDTRPGPVRDRAAEIVANWSALLTDQVEAAQRTGALDEGDEPEQLAFELSAMLALANTMFVLRGDPAAIERARRGIARRLALARAGADARR
jgi:AcrR family transcriptional regulator